MSFTIGIHDCTANFFYIYITFQSFKITILFAFSQPYSYSHPTVRIRFCRNKKIGSTVVNTYSKAH